MYDEVATRLTFAPVVGEQLSGVYTVLDSHQDQYDELFGNKPGFPRWAAVSERLAILL